MDARTTTGQANLQAGADGQPAGLAERFDDHLGWAYRFGTVDHWELFRCELLAALTLALRLDGEAVDPDEPVAVARLGQQHRGLELVLDQARASAEPASDWRGPRTRSGSWRAGPAWWRARPALLPRTDAPGRQS
jgi:hypothetical protein